MAELSDFPNFSLLIQHCFDLKAAGRADEAYALITGMISESRRRAEEEPMWNAWHLQQALGFRVHFARQEDEIKAEQEHLDFCRGMQSYFARAISESAARISTMHAEAGQLGEAALHAREALSFSAQLGSLSPTVISAMARISK